MDDLIRDAIHRGEQQAALVLEARSRALEERVARAPAVTEDLEEIRSEEAARDRKSVV